MIYISKLWKFIQGYVIISIKGNNIERVINKAIENNINMYNILKDINTAYVTIAPKDFRPFIKLCRKYRCKTRIKGKNGIYKLFIYIRLNIPFIIGIVLALFLIFFFTQRVWFIDITGNVTTDDSSLFMTCSENGLYTGCSKNAVDLKMLEENIKLKHKNISWINASLKGTTVHISLSEDKPETKVNSSSEPCNIISAVNCRISSITTDKGTPLVRSNDVVKAGDILISAKLMPSGTEEEPVSDIVHAKGSVRGLVTRTYSFTLPFSTNEKKYTGSKKTEYTIKLFNHTLKLNSISPLPFSDKSRSVIQLKLGENCPLPFFIIRDIYREYVSEPVILTEEDAVKAADTRIVEHIASSYSTDSDIISLKTRYAKGKNSLQVTSEIVSEENVGKESPYINLGGNTLNGTTENSDIS